MQHLFSAWHDISNRLGTAKRILLLSDYDGTLTPIVARPELAVLPEETRKLLEQLKHQHRIKIGVISGRALVDLREKVGIRGIIYAGNHGLEIEGPSVNFIHPLAEEIRPLLRIIDGILTQALGTVRGVLVEHKGLTLSVHYRMVEKRKVETVRGTFNKIMVAPRSLGKIKTTSGKKVLEVRPAINWHKGKAIQLIMKRYAKGGNRSKVLPIYLGDDLTDEDAFEFLERSGGISIFVGEENSPTCARYYLKSPSEVAGFLKTLLEFR